MKTLPEYCEQTITNKISKVIIDDQDINRGDTDVNDMRASLIKSMNIQNIYICPKVSKDGGISFKYQDNDFNLKYTGEKWILTNYTMKKYLDSEAYENRWMKYNNFTCAPKQEEPESEAVLQETTVEETVDETVKNESTVKSSGFLSHIFKH